MWVKKEIDGYWIKNNWGDDKNNAAHYLSDDEIDIILSALEDSDEIPEEDEIYDTFRYEDAEFFQDILGFDDAFDATDIVVDYLSSDMSNAVQALDLDYDLADAAREYCQNREIIYSGDSAKEWLEEKLADDDFVAKLLGYNSAKELFDEANEEEEE